MGGCIRVRFECVYIGVRKRPGARRVITVPVREENYSNLFTGPAKTLKRRTNRSGFWVRCGVDQSEAAVVEPKQVGSRGNGAGRVVRHDHYISSGKLHTIFERQAARRDDPQGQCDQTDQGPGRCQEVLR